MFNDWIDISVLARAYELNCEECLELARQVKVKLGPVTIGKIEGPSDIEIYSRRWTEALLQEGIGEKKIHSINMMVRIINSSWWKGPIPDFEATGERDFDFLHLYVISRLFLVLDLSVNKKEAIQVLYSHDYILKNECNGLTVSTIQAMQNGESSFTAKDTEVEQARAEAAALREENAALKAALEQARQERKAQGGESLTPQQKAAQVRSETALNAWKPKIGAMVKVAVQIGKEGPKERQAGDFYAYFNELDVDLTDEQMRIFRAGVPDEYKDTVGGKAGKT